MLLHTVNRSFDASDALASCLRSAASGSSLLLIEDGVFAARAAAPALAEAARRGIRCFALREDVLARGLDGRIDRAVELVDYKGFVELCAECHAVQAWY